MSKKREAQQMQEYVTKIIPQTCGNCGNLKTTEAENFWGGKNIKLCCGVGGFAVKKMGTCNAFVGFGTGSES